MPAIKPRLAGKHGKFHEGMKKDFGALLKGAAATHRKKRVSGKKHVFAFEPISDMAGGVPWNLDHPCFKPPGHNAVALANREIEAADLGGFLGWANDAGARKPRLESGDALDVIEMMMGDQDIRQRPLPRRERVEDWGGLGRVDRRCGAGRGIMDEDAKSILEAQELLDMGGHAFAGP